MEKIILEALAKMDPEDDKQWTEDGQPMLAKVKELAGSDAVTRKDIVQASHGFTRDVAREAAKAAAEAAKDAQSKIDGAADLADVLGTPEPKKEEPKPSDVEVSGGSEGRRVLLQRAVTAARQAIEDHDLAISKAKQVRPSLEKGLAKAIGEYEAEFPPMRAADATRDWLDKQRDARLARNKPVQFVPGKAPIDQAFRRPTGYGHRRPARPLGAV